MTMLLASFAVVLATAAAAAQPLMPPPRVAGGMNSRVAEAREVVVRSEREWQALWRDQVGDVTAPPAIDFARDQAIAIFAGMKPTPGFEIVIADVRDEAGATVVTYSVTSPRADAILAQVVTQPYLVVRLPRSDRMVRFVRK